LFLFCFMKFQLNVFDMFLIDISYNLPLTIKFVFG